MTLPAEIESKHLPAAAPARESTREVEELVIRPRRGWIAVDWRELYHHRELLYFLIWRDVKVRYKQTVLGVAWAILQPLVTMVIFTVIFFRVTEIEGLPLALKGKEAVWMFAGLVPWLLFQTGMTDGGMSLVNQQSLLTKIYLPRLFVPAASVGRGLVDMMIAGLVFVGLMLYYQPSVSWTVILVPLLVLLTTMASLGVAFMLAALSVTYRDFRFIIPFLMQIWMWVSFIVIPMNIVPERWQPLASINPMFGVVEGYRAAIFADIPWNLTNLAISSIGAAALLLLGLFYFRKTERRFADIA
jgi:lipopolysaccharide transport system permease protein